MQLPQPGILRTEKDLIWKDQFVCYFEVERGGMVSLDELYINMFQWFKKENFKHWGSLDNYPEDLYLHRIRADGVQENLMWWRMFKKPSDSDYICYFCKMDWQNFGAKETEIMYKDKKVKTHKLGIVLRVTWWVQIDPYNKWEKSALGKLQKWFYQYLLDNELENHRDKVREIAKRQEDDIKAYFEMATSKPMPRSFFPESGYKWEKPKPDPEKFAELPRKPDWNI